VYFIFSMHIILIVSYAIFFLQFIKSLQNNLKDKFLFGILSIIFMLLILIDGSKLILLNLGIEKHGMWLHIKLSIFLAIIVENIALFVAFLKKKFFSYRFYEILYWLNYLLFITIISLSLFKFF
jgi:hypothetical protein